MSLIPTDLAGLVGIVLLFVDGLIFGIAVKKAILSVILVIIGIILAGFIGLAIPFISEADIITHVTNIIISQAQHLGVFVVAFPVFWLIGFGIALWKG